MVCPKCGSNDVNVQVVTESQLKDRHHGFFWWIFIGWWWVLFKWIFLTVPALLAAIFIPKKQKLKQRHVSMAVCQQCGNRWKV